MQVKVLRLNVMPKSRPSAFWYTSMGRLLLVKIGSFGRRSLAEVCLLNSGANVSAKVMVPAKVHGDRQGMGDSRCILQ